MRRRASVCSSGAQRRLIGGIKMVFTYNGYCFSYQQIGNMDGYPILVQHGLIATINDVYLFKSLTDAGIRVISIARPGYGESDPYEMENVGEWGIIIKELVYKLGINSFDVLGISSGAPYSYSIANACAEKIKNIYILSGIPALYDDNIVAHWPFPIDRNADIRDLEILVKKLFFSDLSELDLKREDIKASMNNDCFGPALDLKIRCKDWGFKLENLNSKVYMQHSKYDNIDAAKITAGLITGCQLDITENTDHFSSEIFEQFCNRIVLKMMHSS